MYKGNKIRWIQRCFAPTLCVSDWIKGQAHNTIERGERVKKLNKTYLMIAIVLLGVMIFWEQIDYNRGFGFVMFIQSFYCLSRCNEIFMAFIKDAFDKLDPKKRENNGLAYYERVQMALRSYLELVINYAILFYVLNAYSRQYSYIIPVFNKPFEDILSAVYFSVITIVAIGYGDIYPVHPISRMLVCYEVITGILLLVVSFTIYTSLSLSD